MHAILITVLVISGTIWLAIEHPKFRRSLWITLGVCALLIGAAIALVVYKPGHHG